MMQRKCALTVNTKTLEVLMNEILSMGISQMPGLSFDCSCGRRHTVEIKHIVVGSGSLSEAARLAAEMRAKKIFMLADDNTYEVCGKKAVELFKKESINLHPYIFKTDAPLVPDEKALGRLLVEMDADTPLSLWPWGAARSTILHAC
jgi:glycerol-1-phosphate dehydrogenase [NAD(P)+]